VPRTADKRGRSLTKGTFALIPEAVVRSAAYTATSCAGRALLVELAVLYRSKNNGFLGLSARQAAKRLGCSKDTAARAFRELQERGLIERTQRGDFKAKALSLASEWRLTWRRCDRSNHLPSHAYLNWKQSANERV
jgi:predicted transcriptional regulator of viral defense system